MKNSGIIIIASITPITNVCLSPSCEDEFQLFISGMLTRDSRLDLIRRLQLVVDEFSQKSRNDANVPLSEKKGTSLSIATRPWRVKVFESMRRVEGEG